MRNRTRPRRCRGVVVEVVNLATDADVPAVGALDALAEVHAHPEVVLVDVDDAAARAVDLLHRARAERQEVVLADASVCRIDLELHGFHFVQFFVR